jgi:hypothetical protein
MRTILATLALALAMASTPALAADDEDAEITKMAKEHYKAGLDAYKAGKYEVAIKELKKAYLLKRLPPLLLNIAATYRKMGDLDLAIHFYKKFLDEAPPDAKERNEVQSTVAELEQQKASGGNQPPPPPEDRPPPPEDRPPPPPRRDTSTSNAPKEFTHVVVDAAPPDVPLDLRVSMPVMKGVKVYLNYRLPGQEDFKAVLMKRRGAEKVGRIPADAMQGKSIQYFIEAKDPSGAVVKSSGSVTSPNIVMIDPSAPPQTLASVDDSQQPRDEQPRDEQPRAKKNLDDEEAPIMGEGAGQRTPTPRKPKKQASSGGGMSPLMTAGVALLAGGGGLALVGGAVMLPLANMRANQVSDAYKMPVVSDPMYPNVYFNNDPVDGSKLADYQSQGQGFNAAGIAFLAIGGAAAVTGAVLIIVDQVSGGSSSQRERPAPERRRRSDDDMSWFLTPSVGPGGASVSGGFRF